MSLITLEDLHAAQRRIAGVAVSTGLHRLNAAVLRRAGFGDALPEIWLKAESEQPIGSFKLRGAYNKIASLTPEQLQAGIVAHSSGNHAQGVAYAARALGAHATIVIPENAPMIKREATEALGAEVLLCGPSHADRVAMANAVLAERGGTLVPPFDDDQIIAGQGTCGLEILDQLPTVDVIVVPVSGGGLLSGVAAAAKLSSTSVQVWGAEPELAGDAKQSFDSRSLVEWDSKDTTRTIADGLRTQSVGRRNLEHILAYVDGIVTVTEDEILAATRLLLTETGIAVEPSGAVTLAAVLFHVAQLPAVQQVAVVVSGGNIEPALRERLLAAAAA